MTFKRGIIIEAGDVVALKIGGPNMLLEIIDMDGIAHCIWFNQLSELQKDMFSVEHLQLVEKGNGAPKVPENSNGATSS